MPISGFLQGLVTTQLAGDTTSQALANQTQVNVPVGANSDANGDKGAIPQGPPPPAPTTSDNTPGFNDNGVQINAGGGDEYSDPWVGDSGDATPIGSTYDPNYGDPNYSDPNAGGGDAGGDSGGDSSSSDTQQFASGGPVFGRRAEAPNGPINIPPIGNGPFGPYRPPWGQKAEGDSDMQTASAEDTDAEPDSSTGGDEDDTQNFAAGGAVSAGGGAPPSTSVAPSVGVPGPLGGGPVTPIVGRGPAPYVSPPGAPSAVAGGGFGSMVGTYAPPPGKGKGGGGGHHGSPFAEVDREEAEKRKRAAAEQAKSDAANARALNQEERDSAKAQADADKLYKQRDQEINDIEKHDRQSQQQPDPAQGQSEEPAIPAPPKSMSPGSAPDDTSDQDSGPAGDDTTPAVDDGGGGDGYAKGGIVKGYEDGEEVEQNDAAPEEDTPAIPQDDAPATGSPGGTPKQAGEPGAYDENEPAGSPVDATDDMHRNADAVYKAGLELLRKPLTKGVPDGEDTKQAAMDYFGHKEADTKSLVEGVNQTEGDTLHDKVAGFVAKAGEAIKNMFNAPPGDMGSEILNGTYNQGPQNEQSDEYGIVGNAAEASDALKQTAASLRAEQEKNQHAAVAKLKSGNPNEAALYADQMAAFNPGQAGTHTEFRGGNFHVTTYSPKTGEQSGAFQLTPQQYEHWLTSGSDRRSIGNDAHERLLGEARDAAPEGLRGMHSMGLTGGEGGPTPVTGQETRGVVPQVNVPQGFGGASGKELIHGSGGIPQAPQPPPAAPGQAPAPAGPQAPPQGQVPPQTDWSKNQAVMNTYNKVTSQMQEQQGRALTQPEYSQIWQQVVQAAESLPKPGQAPAPAGGAIPSSPQQLPAGPAQNPAAAEADAQAAAKQQATQQMGASQAANRLGAPQGQKPSIYNIDYSKAVPLPAQNPQYKDGNDPYWDKKFTGRIDPMHSGRDGGKSAFAQQAAQQGMTPRQFYAAKNAGGRGGSSAIETGGKIVHDMPDNMTPLQQSVYSASVRKYGKPNGGPLSYEDVASTYSRRKDQENIDKRDMLNHELYISGIPGLVDKQNYLGPGGFESELKAANAFMQKTQGSDPSRAGEGPRPALSPGGKAEAERYDRLGPNMIRGGKSSHEADAAATRAAELTRMGKAERPEKNTDNVVMQTANSAANAKIAAENSRRQVDNKPPVSDAEEKVIRDNALRDAAGRRESLHGNAPAASQQGAPAAGPPPGKPQEFDQGGWHWKYNPGTHKYDAVSKVQ